MKGVDESCGGGKKVREWWKGLGEGETGGRGGEGGKGGEEGGVGEGGGQRGQEREGGCHRSEVEGLGVGKERTRSHNYMSLLHMRGEPGKTSSCSAPSTTPSP